MGAIQKNEFAISGKVIFVGMPIFFTEKMSKRILVLEVYVNGKYRQEVPFDFVNDNMNMLNTIRKDDWVTVDFILRGNGKVQADGKKRWYSNNEGITCIKE